MKELFITFMMWCRVDNLHDVVQSGYTSDFYPMVLVTYCGANVATLTIFPSLWHLPEAHDSYQLIYSLQDDTLNYSSSKNTAMNSVGVGGHKVLLNVLGWIYDIAT